jgi:hypothetical protein
MADESREDEKGATEDQVERITTITGDEVLGYEGSGRGEHSGESAPVPLSQEEKLADNRPGDMGKKK